ncbi:MAG: tetratricopeptide repeat protein [Gammaproteobacteria bacterium]|nr:tetratricopeptide repeat protein [Gammaproteobacteria bacterium]
MPIKSNSRYRPLLSLVAVVLLQISLSACQTTPSVAKPEPEPEITAAPTLPAADETATEPQTPFEQALSDSKAGKIEQAIEQFKILQQRDPTPPKVHTNLGLLYLHEKNLGLATEAFLNAIQQDKNDAIAYNHLAIIQRQQGDFKQALFNYYKAINVDPEYANAHLNLGILLDLYLQELPKALEEYLKYQQLTNNNNEDVEKWIIDLRRRIDSTKQ